MVAAASAELGASEVAIADVEASTGEIVICMVVYEVE